MEELRRYKKGIDLQADQDFKEKKRFEKVYYANKTIFVKKSFLNWLYYPLAEVTRIELLKGSRQLKQCCGAPIYQNKLLVLTNVNQEHLYLTVEETDSDDHHYTEKLLKQLAPNNPQITII